MDYYHLCEKHALGKFLKRYSSSSNVILDLGCGDGRWTKRLIGRNIVGIDMSIRQLGKARQNCSARPNIYLIRGDAENLPLKSNAFDTIISLHVIYLSPNPEAFLRELYRVLKPGGICILDLPNPYFPRIRKPLTEEIGEYTYGASEIKKFKGMNFSFFTKNDNLKVNIWEGYQLLFPISKTGIHSNLIRRFLLFLEELAKKLPFSYIVFSECIVVLQRWPV